MNSQFLVDELIHLAFRLAQGRMQHEKKWLDWLVTLFPIHDNGYLVGTLLQAVQLLISKEETVSCDAYLNSQYVSGRKYVQGFTSSKKYQ